jgi:translocation and assembly module TamA
MFAGALALGAGAAHAEIRVTIEGVDGPVRTNVLAFLSLQRFSTLDDLPEDLVNRLVQRAEGEVTAALRPFGYYEPTVQAELTGDSRRWNARIVVTPGEPVMLRDVDVLIEGPGRDQPFLRELLDRETLVPGQQLNHGTYEQLKGELQRRAAANGYLDARFTTAELLVDPVERTAVARLRLDTGERYRFGALTIEQSALDPRFVKRFVRFREGDWYSSAELLRTQFALDDTQFYRQVEVLPGDRDPATLTVPVQIAMTPNDRHRWTVGVGYETDFGPRVRLGWENRRVNSRGHRFRAEANLSERNQVVTGTYVVPIGDPALEKFELTLRVANEELADLTTQSTALTPSVTHVLGRWQRVLAVSVLRSEESRPASRSDYTLVIPSVTFAPVPRQFVGESADTGLGFFGQLLGSSSVLGSESEFLQLRLRNDWRWRVAPKWSLLARVDVGATAVRALDDLPPQVRFFAGGDRSVRGYGFNSLSPTVCEFGPDGLPDRRPCGDPDGDDELVRVGGTQLATGSVEVEYDLPRDFALAVFFDAGNAFESFSNPDLKYSAGVGVRYRLPFVSVGVDVAKPFDGGRPRLHLNISPIYL